jgi:hypothetical protein
VSVKPKTKKKYIIFVYEQHENENSSHSSFDGRALQFLDYFSVSSLSVAARHIQKKERKKILPFLSVSIFISYNFCVCEKICKYLKNKIFKK